MATSKWFDLRNADAMLERCKNDVDGVFLKLTVKEPASFLERAADIVCAGWEASPDEPNVFINSTRMNTMSEIRASLYAFFDADQVQLNDISKLPGNIYVGKFERGQPAQPETIMANVLGLSVDLQEQILKRVSAAAAMAGLSVKNRLPFDGKLFKVWDEAFERYPEGATAMIVEALNEYSFGNYELFEKLEEAIMNKPMEKAVWGLEYDLEQRVVARNEEISKSVFFRSTSFTKNQSPNMIYDKEALKKAHFAYLQNELRDIPLTILDGHIVPERKLGEKIPDKVGTISIRYEPGLPTELKWQAAKRIEAAVSAFQEVFNPYNERSVFGSNSLSIMVTKNGLPEVAAGLYKARSSTEFSVGQIMYNPYNAGALVHELAHAMDFGHRAILADDDPMSTPNKLQTLVVETGAQRSAQVQIDRAIENGARFSQNRLDYLLDPSEVFARTVQAVMVEYYHAKGDIELSKIGGGLRPSTDFAMSDPKLLNSFTAAVKVFNQEFSFERNFKAVEKMMVDEPQYSNSSPSFS